MPLSRRLAEPGRDAINHRLGQRDLRQKHQDLGCPRARQHSRGSLEIDLCFSGARNAVNQGALKGFEVHHFNEPVGGRPLAGVQRGCGDWEAAARFVTSLGNSHGPEGPVLQKRLDHSG